MKKESETIQKDYSFLQAMSTAELQEILRRDMDLSKDESDMDLILSVMELLEAREGTGENTPESENALINLRKLINRRNAMFAEDDSSGKSTSPSGKPGSKKILWLRLISAAAIVVLLFSIGFAGANAKGYDLWGGIVRWTRETFNFGEKKPFFDRNTAFADLDVILQDNGIIDPVLPNWMPEQFSCDDIQVFENPNELRIVAIAAVNDSYFVLQITRYNQQDISIRHLEINGSSVRSYYSNGIEHFIAKNNNSTKISWVRENLLVELEFPGEEIDAEGIIDSIYKE